MTDLRYPETEQRRERRVAMPWAMRLLMSLALLVALSARSRAQYPAKCDANRDCIGRAITTTVTYGKGAQYTDVDTSYRLSNFDTAITFEAWISPQPQPGKIQYIAGLWGPNKDNNDQWVLYLRDNTLTFALSMDNSYKGTFGSEGYGAKAQEKLGVTRGKGFRHEKTKKKRGTYIGGGIDQSVHSIKFDDNFFGDD